MKSINKFGKKFVIALALVFGFTNSIMAEEGCSSKLFSVTIDSKLTISDVIENLADTCGLTVIVNDDSAKMRMNKKLYYVKLKNSTLKGFLNTILNDNDLHYTLKGNKLKISYLITRTFRVHYVSGKRTGKSNANVTIANPENLSSTGGGTDSESESKTGISIETNDEFKFWENVEKEIQRILIGAADESTHYVNKGGTWVGPDGKVWEYNPLAPIVNAEAGMVTVTGTQKQISRVAHYIEMLTDQLKSQVLIDVRIISVSFDDSSTAGVDWSQLYGLQNHTINTLIMAQRNISEATYTATEGITDFTALPGTKPNNAAAFIMTGSNSVNEVVKFLTTQGDVKAISSPRVMTLNNQPAMISVGKDLFYQTTAELSVQGTEPATTQRVESVFAGILLDITPEIAPNGLITLKINPSISETVETITSSAGVRQIPPDLVRRQIASVIKVRDGQHAILGGLISSKTGYENNKVPVLGDLPVLNHLFKSEQKINTVEELVLIITPHIVNSANDVSLKDLGYIKVNEK